VPAGMWYCESALYWREVKGGSGGVICDCRVQISDWRFDVGVATERQGYLYRMSSLNKLVFRYTPVAISAACATRSMVIESATVPVESADKIDSVSAYD